MSIEQNASYFRAANTAKVSFSEAISTADPFDMDFQSVRTEDNLVLASRGKDGGDASFMTLVQSILQKC